MVTGPPTVTAPIVPPVADPNAAVAANTNDIGTPMGALCWTRWETARRLLSQAGASELPAATVTTLVIDINGAAARTKTEGLPADVVVFRNALFSALDQARNDAAKGPIANDRVTQLFDFEQYPGAAAYMAAAKKDPGCRQP